MNPDNSRIDREERLQEALLVYVEQAQAGHVPDRDRLLEIYPDLRAELEEFFATHEQVERLAAPWRSGSQCSDSQAGHSDKGSRGSGPGRTVEGLPEIGQLGDYRLLREIGRGGMGVVYEAEQVSLHRRVALKVLPFAAAIDPRQLQRFQNEALAAAHLRHENIVPVHAVGCERGVHYYAMQMIDGQSLAALLDELRCRAGKSGRHPPSRPPKTTGETAATYSCRTDSELRTVGDRLLAQSISRERQSGRRRYYDWVAGLGRQAALALEHAHQMGIVHRDIKPANLLLDLRGQVWITDFGLARISNDAGLTVTGEMLGTLRYASPEQALARAGLVDHRSDVYSLGATLYELLTLQPLFDGRDRHELLRQIANDEPRPLRSLDRSIPAELETLVLKAIAKEPGERYATAQALADDLQRFLEDRPIQARRPSVLEKAIKWGRRHRSVVASALAALLLSLAALATATVLTARAYDREHQKAEEAAEQRARAEASFRQARQAVDQLAQVGEEELVGDPRLQGVRRRLLEAALAYYQDFIDQRSDDPSIQTELETSRGRVKAIIGELTTLMGASQYIPLHHTEVCDELGLSETQRQAIAQIHEQWQDAFRDFGRLDAAEREKRFLTLAQAQEAEVAQRLSPAQLRRLKQIALQWRSPFAFSELDVARTLQLTAEQKKQARTILDQLMPPPPQYRGPRHFAEQRKQAQEKILALLTPEQRKKWEEMTGKPSPPRHRSTSPAPPARQ